MEQSKRYQFTAGLPVEVIQEIVGRVWDVTEGRGMDYSRDKIGLYRQVGVCLILLCQNMSQMVIADMYQMSQSMICRIWPGSPSSWRRC